jgi:glutathione S-transferase
MRYELYYWPGIQGRGNCAPQLEEAGADYLDTALLPGKGGGVAALGDSCPVTMCCARRLPHRS